MTMQVLEVCDCGSDDIREVEDRDDSVGYHSTEYRCMSCGSSAEYYATPRPEPIAITVAYQIGDVIEYADQDSGRLCTATILDTNGTPSWISIIDDGAPPEDEADIHTSLVRRIVPWAEYLNTERVDTLRNVPIERRLAMSIQLQNKENIA